MLAIVQTAPGGPETLHLGEVDTPRPGPGQLLVKVKAAGINRADLMQREGKYPPPPGDSAILGLEIAGEVAALGEDVSGFVIGDRVAGLVGGGGYAQYCVLDAGTAITIPEALDDVAAASLPEAWMTAWFNLVELGGLREDLRVLVHAGASGVGSAAIQLCKAYGAWVAVTAGGPEKGEYCKRLGADMVIDYKTRDFAAEVKQAGGVDLILDGVGGDYLPHNQACLNPDGQIIVIGMLRGPQAEANMGLLLVKRQTVRGSTLRPQALPVKRRLAQQVRDFVMPRLATGALQVTVDKVFDWEQVAAAHHYVAAGKNLGKVMLRLGSAD
ncbi:NAD(P)H-quinone oxidoreductase [Silvimonas iriomotensis]|uniref:NAD(P)H quinone oxidoreductase n=1 Tax=Silvimonas iriomotensis TaxID=449662 RepID=A0ABQ2P7G6_9NEIS|nr:NAD(P)H-quinone oxidoreductase [Silvimonas iriomotensis]GGP19584.1 NAD(P)H quinone oxidoreductase [Silvimonas iriomotensis]